MMTVDEAAEMLGVSSHAMRCVMYKHRISLQGAVEMYRSGEVNRGVRASVKHRVHGRVTTVKREAARLGVTATTIECWRTVHRHDDGSRALLEEAVDYYQGIKDGTIRYKKPGFAPAKHYVHGKQMTIAEAAELVGMQESSMRNYLYRNKCSLETAVRRIEERKQEKAVKALLKILGVEK